MTELATKRIAAEALAIVASILLAFAIDAWWDDRAEARQEQRLLTALLAEFETNIETLQQARMEYERQYLLALRLLEYVPAKVSELDDAELVELFRSLLVAGTIHLESGAHDGLLASGELNLVGNDTLRNRLAAWPSYVVEWSEEQDSVFNEVFDMNRPYFAKLIPIRSLQPGFAPFRDGDAPPAVPTIPVDLDALIESSRSVAFDNLVYQRTQSLWYAMRDGETLIAQAELIRSLLRDELAEASQ